MPRVPLVDVASLAAPVRERVEGHPINLYKTLAHLGDGFLAFSNLGQWIRHKSHLEGRTREMAILAVGIINESAYELSHHIKIGRDFGLSDTDIEGVVAYLDGRPSGLSDPDQLVVAATREITVDGKISDATWDALSATYELELRIELTLVVAFYSAVTRLLGSLEVEVEEKYQGYLTEFGFDFD